MLRFLLPTRVRVATSALVLPFFMACDQTSTTAIPQVQRDSAGVAVVSNPGPDRPLDWQFVEVLRLGGPLDPDQAFFGIDRNSIAFDSTGKVYVLDKGNYQLRIFDAAGRAVRTMGRKGMGPGELGRPIALRVDSGGVIRVLDFAKQSWNRFAPDGSALEGEPIDDVFALGWQLAWIDAGMVTSFRGGYRSDADSVFDGVKLVSATDTTVLGGVSMPRPKDHIYHECRIIIPLPPVFAQSLEWDASGNRTAVNDQHAYVVDVYEGPDLVLRTSRDSQPEVMTREDAVANVDEMRTGEGQPCDINPAKAVDARGFEPLLQAISGIAVDPEGRIWVRRARHQPEEAAAIDVLAPDGRYLGTLDATNPFPVLFDPQGRPVSIETDEMGVEYIVIYELLR